MKLRQRLASAMACSLLLSQLPAMNVLANDQLINKSTSKATLEVTVNLEYPVAENKDLDLKADVLQDGKVVDTKILECTQGENGPSSYITFEGLDLGTYEVRLSGNGYTTYTSEPIELLKTEKHLVVDAGKETFTKGDVDADGKISDSDLKALEAALGTTDTNYDLTGDKKVDIEDLAQMFWNKQAKGEATIYSTRMILSQVLNVSAVQQEISGINDPTLVIEGNVESLFDGDDTTALSFTSQTPISNDNPIKIPVAFNDEMAVSQIMITAPADNGPKAGKIVYFDENDVRQEVQFSSEDVATVSRSRDGKTKVVKINLGKQVPIKKLTIEVTQTEKADGLLAAVSKIEFMQDVVENAVDQEQGLIKNLKGSPLNEGATLSWNMTSNVTGYKVSYGTEPGNYTHSRYTTTNSIEIDGLENGTPYYFVVQATNDGWEGPQSKEITIVPEAQQRPETPANVTVASFNKGIKVNYRTGTDATGANIYYKKVTDKAYSKVENTYSGQVIKGLENDVEYMIYVVATNSSGESAPSEVLRTTPAVEEIVIPEIPTFNRLDNSHITEITLSDPANVATNHYPEGFDINNLVDNDFTTHWTAATYHRARGVIATFDQPYEMDYVAVVSRLDSDLDRYDGTKKYSEYPHFYTIRVWETLDSEPKVLVNKEVIPMRSNGLFILPFEKTKVAKIDVQIHEWDGAGASTLSEVMFYEAGDMVERVDNLFANGTYTKLKEGVTLDDINQLEDELDKLEGAVLWVDKATLKAELQLARELYTTGTSSNMGELVEVVQTYQKSTATKQNFAMEGLSNLQATGVMANAGDEIVVYVDAPEDGTLPELVVSQFFGDGDWSKSIPLAEGRNVIEVPSVVNYHTQKGGSLYLAYNGEVQETTTVRIVNATKIPTLELASLEDEQAVKVAIKAYVEHLNDYVAGLDLTNKAKNPANSTEIGTDKVLLSLPAEEVYRGLSEGIENDIDAQVERLYESLMTWDVTMKLHYDVLGLSEDAEEEKDRYPKARLNVRYMPMNNGVFMYASASHVGIRYSSGAGLVKGTQDVGGYFGWGINHEIGHIINDKNYVIGEVTNNIFSLFAQTINGGKSRLELSNTYEDIYKKVTSRDKGMAGNVFVTLGMFWQLHLAYDTQNTSILPDDFYPTLHKLSRESNFEGVDTINYFIRLASDTAKKDLIPFFKKWGAKITSETYAYTSKYEEETRAIQYLNDEAMRYRLNNGESMADGSSASVSTIVEQSVGTNDTSVKLKLSTTMNEEALLGYEIYRDGELIAFTTENEYIDDISANNITHTYSVVAYDKLLNTTDKAYADEVYIGTDGVIAKSEYFTERTTSNAIQITLPNTPEVVGLKLTDTTISGNRDYVVEVSEDGENWTVAKEDTLQDGTSLIYFNKPGVNAEDDRIWTYDAKYIRITGECMDEIDTEQIEVLSYPGDAVYFTEGAIGYLGSDYEFDGGMIKEGTLVVMGSYRGHPVYNKIVLSANYVNDKDFDETERPGYSNENTVEAVAGDLYMFAELPEDEEVSKVGNGIWLFVPKEQKLPAQIKANMFRTDDASSTEGGRLVSDTKWLLVPSEEDMPIIELS